MELDTVDYDLGGARYLRDGTVLPDEVLDEWRGLDALLLGAVGTPGVPPGVIERGLLLKMRFELDLYINQRPVPRTPRRGIDMVVIRENTEGTYAGEGGVPAQGHARTRSPPRARSTPAWASSAASATPSSWPQTRARKHLTLVHKTNVLTFAGDLWERTFNEVAAEYPDVTTAYNHVDAACIYFVQSPEQYDVDRHRQPLRRHPHRPRRRRLRRHRLRRRRATSTPPAPARRCSSRCTARPPTSPARTRPTPSPPSSRAALMLDLLGEADAADRVRKACADTATLTGSTTEIGDAVAARL